MASKQNDMSWIKAEFVLAPITFGLVLGLGCAEPLHFASSKGACPRAGLVLL